MRNNDFHNIVLMVWPMCTTQQVVNGSVPRYTNNNSYSTIVEFYMIIQPLISHLFEASPSFGQSEVYLEGGILVYDVLATYLCLSISPSHNTIFRSKFAKC